MRRRRCGETGVEFCLQLFFKIAAIGPIQRFDSCVMRGGAVQYLCSIAPPLLVAAVLGPVVTGIDLHVIAHVSAVRLAVRVQLGVATRCSGIRRRWG